MKYAIVALLLAVLLAGMSAVWAQAAGSSCCQAKGKCCQAKTACCPKK